jgi:hypothetical protein
MVHSMHMGSQFLGLALFIITFCPKLPLYKTYSIFQIMYKINKGEIKFDNLSTIQSETNVQKRRVSKRIKLDDG